MSRPNAIALWISRAREKKYAYMPVIPDVSALLRQWRVWWAELQPEVRGRSWPLEEVDSDDIEWDTLQEGGRLGIILALLSLSWCVRAVRKVGDRKDVAEAVEDVRYVLEQMASASAATETGSKRKRTAKSATGKKRARH